MRTTDRLYFSSPHCLVLVRWLFLLFGEPLARVRATCGCAVPNKDTPSPDGTTGIGSAPAGVSPLLEVAVCSGDRSQNTRTGHNQSDVTFSAPTTVGNRVILFGVYGAQRHFETNW